MIVASLLLILVAVTLLVLGLTGGSSGLLISSIVASLLAAIALVIGARRAAGTRRAAADHAVPEPGPTPPDPAYADPAYADPAYADPAYADPAYAAADPGYASAGRAYADADTGEFLAPDETAEFIAEPEFAAQRAAAASPPPPPAQAAASAGTSQPAPAGTSQAAAASAGTAQAGTAQPGDTRPGWRGRRRGARAGADFVPPGEGFAADSVRSNPIEERTGPGRDMPDPEVDLGFGDDGPWDTPEQPFTTQAVDEHAARAAAADQPPPDYDRASSAISAARSEDADEHAWRRATAPIADDLPGPDALPGDLPGAGDRAGGGERSGFGDRAGGSDRAGRDVHAEAAAHAGLSGLNDDFAEPDADDPDDEPLPQAVRPTDAVRVARLDAEVLVVDGRPRYHMADCTHLVGRLTEPIPVNEAVELGFSPCGLCRPVDRLVAAAAW